MSKEFSRLWKLCEILCLNTYTWIPLQKGRKKAENMLEYLYMYLDKNFEVVEKELEFTSKNVPKERTICDYIAE